MAWEGREYMMRNARSAVCGDVCARFVYCVIYTGGDAFEKWKGDSSAHLRGEVASIKRNHKEQ